MFQKNKAAKLHFSLINKTTGEGITSGTINATVYQDGASFSRQSLSSGTNHLGGGFWFYQFSTAAMNADSIALGVTHSDAIPTISSINTFIRTTEEIYDGITGLEAGVNITHVNGATVSDFTDFHVSTVGLSSFDPTVDIVSVGGATVSADINAVNGSFASLADFRATSVGVSIDNIVRANVVQVATTGTTSITDFHVSTVGLSGFDPTTDEVYVASSGITSASIDSTGLAKIVSGIYDKVVDGSTDLETVMQMLLAWMAGKVDVTDNGTNRTITFYRRDGSTSSFEVVVDETTSQEGQRSSTGTIT